MEAQIQVHDLFFKPFLDAETIQKRIKELGQEISETYKGQCPILLGVLNGAFMFLSDLAKAVSIDCEITFVKLASYEGLESTGTVSTQIGLSQDIKGRPIIIVEDIVDTGKTLSAFIPTLQELGPTSISVAALLQKPDALKYDLEVAYLGFSIPDKFVVGYGLDYNGRGRNLPSIYQLIES